jgi:hypothetical protein
MSILEYLEKFLKIKFWDKNLTCPIIGNVNLIKEPMALIP